MAQYLIKDIPADTMKDFKTACAHFKRTMREDLLASMVVTIDRYRHNIGQFKGKTATIKRKGKKK